MPITITVTDGTITANVITIEDARIAATTAALSAAIGDLTPPANAARAIRQAVAAWIRTARRQGREGNARSAAETQLGVTVAAIAADEALAP